MLIGLDIGGTKLLVAAADNAGAVIRRARADTPPGLDRGLDLLARMARDVAGAEQPRAIGAACGGPIDWRAGIVSPLHQPEWRNVPLRAYFERAFGCPLRVEVDTDAAALAEYRHQLSRGRAYSRLLYLTLSTGMGGGLIIDGAIYRGAGGSHPEAGHQGAPYRLRREQPVLCECGAEGCLEALVSGNAIQRLYGCPAPELETEDWAEVAWNFGQGLRNLAVLYAPDAIIVGGGVAVGGGEHFIQRAADVMRAGLRLVDAPRVELSGLGYDTALHGAIALAVEAAG